MSMPPLIKHHDHEVVIKLTTDSKHAAYYFCINCRKWVAWLSYRETEEAKRQGLIENATSN
jgi:hypothetical protein